MSVCISVCVVFGVFFVVQCCRCCGRLPLPVPFDVLVLCIVAVCISCVSVCHVLCLCFVCFLSVWTVWDTFAKGFIAPISDRWSWIHPHYLLEERSSKCNKAAGKLVPDASCPLMISPQIPAPPFCSHVKFLNLLSWSPYCSQTVWSIIELKSFFY